MKASSLINSEIIGLEVSGLIEEMGEDVIKEGKWKIGDRVMALLSGSLNLIIKQYRRWICRVCSRTQRSCYANSGKFNI